jgi:predicted O-methyltransferase YrrM
MKYIPDLETIDGSIFELRPHHTVPTREEWICLRKNREFINRYLALAEEFHNANMVEVGVDRGGSTAFFTKLLKPRTLVAIELSTRGKRFINNFLSEQDPEGRIQIHWGVDQSDRVVVPEIVNRAFGEDPLDLVVDDGSHVLAPSTATFEMLFPRLRPGGLYVLEDWSADQLMEREVDNALEVDIDGQFAGRFLAAAKESSGNLRRMCVLICQLVITSGRKPDWVSEIRVMDGFCEVRRGSAEIPGNAPIQAYIGAIGSEMFDGDGARARESCS